MSVIQNNTIQPSSGQALTIKDEGGTASITVATNGEATFAENIKITNGKGIDFSAVSGSASGSASAVLDDYEEGTWTPTYGATGSDPTSVNYAINTGTYTKIGDTVHCQVTMQTTSLSVGSGTVQIKGLPFTARNTSHLDSPFVTYAYSWGTNNNPISGRVIHGQSYVELNKFNAGDQATTGTHYGVDAGTMPTSASTNVLKGSFTYKI